MSNRKGRGQEVNRTELAEFFGIAMPTVDDWIRRGCPVVERGGRGRAWKFNTAEVATWRIERVRDEATGVASASEAELRRRKMAAETGKAELEFAIAKGEVAPVRQFQMAITKVNAELRASLRIIPVRVTRMIVGETDEQVIKRKIADEIDKALSALSEADLLTDEDLEMDDDEDDE